MRRREFVKLIAGAVAYPFTAPAQQKKFQLWGCSSPTLLATGDEVIE
jgi:hypothetical protein